MHRSTSHVIFLHRSSFETAHRRCAASQRVAGRYRGTSHGVLRHRRRFGRQHRRRTASQHVSQAMIKSRKELVCSVASRRVPTFIEKCPRYGKSSRSYDQERCTFGERDTYLRTKRQCGPCISFLKLRRINGKCSLPMKYAVNCLH